MFYIYFIHWNLLPLSEAVSLPFALHSVDIRNVSHQFIPIACSWSTTIVVTIHEIWKIRVIMFWISTVHTSELIYELWPNAFYAVSMFSKAVNKFSFVNDGRVLVRQLCQTFVGWPSIRYYFYICWFRNIRINIILFLLTFI